MPFPLSHSPLPVRLLSPDNGGTGGGGGGESPYFRSPSSIRFLVIHCTATRCTQDYTEEQLIRDHQLRGFRTAGYHFYIRRDGKTTRFRALQEVGAHARPYNHCSIGIAYEGGLDADGCPADTRTPAQVQRLREVVGHLQKLFPDAVVVGHCDLPGASRKACPCFDAATL